MQVAKAVNPPTDFWRTRTRVLPTTSLLRLARCVKRKSLPRRILAKVPRRHSRAPRRSPKHWNLQRLPRRPKESLVRSRKSKPRHWTTQNTLFLPLPREPVRSEPSFHPPLENEGFANLDTPSEQLQGLRLSLLDHLMSRFHTILRCLWWIVSISAKALASTIRITGSQTRTEFRQKIFHLWNRWEWVW